MFLSVTVKDNASPKLRNLLGSTTLTLQRMVEETTAAMMPFLRQNAPVGRHYTYSGSPVPGGTLRDSLRWEVGMLGAVLLGAAHGRYVIMGTRPHTIVARNAAALAFYWERVGQSVRFRRVNHPGNRPNDFRYAAVQQAFDTNVFQNTVAGVLAGWLRDSG